MKLRCSWLLKSMAKHAQVTSTLWRLKWDIKLGDLQIMHLGFGWFVRNYIGITNLLAGIHIQVELSWFCWFNFGTEVSEMRNGWESHPHWPGVAAIQKCPCVCQDWNLRLRWLLWIYHISAVGPCDWIWGQLLFVVGDQWSISQNGEEHPTMGAAGTWSPPQGIATWIAWLGPSRPIPSLCRTLPWSTGRTPRWSVPLTLGGERETRKGDQGCQVEVLTIMDVWAGNVTFNFIFIWKVWLYKALVDGNLGFLCQALHGNDDLIYSYNPSCNCCIHCLGLCWGCECHWYTSWRPGW